jgi:hypothetical protein
LVSTLRIEPLLSILSKPFASNREASGGFVGTGHATCPSFALTLRGASFILVTFEPLPWFLLPFNL